VSGAYFLLRFFYMGNDFIHFSLTHFFGGDSLNVIYVAKFNLNDDKFLNHLRPLETSKK
jgi:hypothetical protein